MPTALESGAIQGDIASAPVWAMPVAKGVGIVWISSPKGDLPPDSTPGASGHLQAMREFAEANPDLTRRIAAVLVDLARAIDDRPTEVKAAVAQLFADLPPSSLDLLFASEAPSWQAQPATTEEMHPHGSIGSTRPRCYSPAQLSADLGEPHAEANPRPHRP
jgi:ABC-type nitrate/sulfonate/bicarbonate transport system substrate-binding protein